MKNITSKGFTLIELIIVIAIIGILSSVILPKLSGFIEEANATAVEADAKCILTAYDAYNEDNQKAPNDLAELKPYLSISDSGVGMKLVLDAATLGDKKFIYEKKMGAITFVATCLKNNSITVVRQT